MSLHRRYIKTLLKFRYAFNGTYFVFKTQSSLRKEAVIACIALFLGILFHITFVEFIIIAALSFLVFAFEMMNTAVERICDYMQPHHDKTIGLIKDVSSGSVLFVCIASVIVGCYIYLHRIWPWFQSVLLS